MSAGHLFPEQEYRLRLDRVRGCMADAGVVALVVDECELLHYFTGYAVTENLYRAAVIPLEGEPCMVLRALDVAPFLAASWLREHHAFVDTADPLAELAAVVTRSGWSSARVALDLNSYCMPARRFQQLSALLPGVDWVDFSHVLRPLRLRKSAPEIAIIERAAQIADGAMSAVATTLGPGASPRDAAATAAAAFLRLGADTGRTGPIAVARGWDFLHAGLTDQPLREGDVLHLELVPKVGGYCAKLMRPVFIGTADAAATGTAATLIALQDGQIAAMVPGAVAGNVDAIVRDGVIAAGLRASYPNNTGYTLGYIFEQGPRSSDFTRVFTAGASWTLEENMVFHMYTSANGLAFSETVRVARSGGERLTRTPRALLSA